MPLPWLPKREPFTPSGCFLPNAAWLWPVIAVRNAAACLPMPPPGRVAENFGLDEDVSDGRWLPGVGSNGSQP